MDQSLREIADDIAMYGWTVMRVSADGPGPDFAYSIGMVRTLGHPEILVIGLPLAMAHRLINDVGAVVRNGQRFVAGGVTDQLLKGYEVTFRRVPDYQYGAYIGWGLRFYEHAPFPVLQMVYPDRAGRWPWHEGAGSECTSFSQFQRMNPGNYTLTPLFPACSVFEAGLCGLIRVGQRVDPLPHRPGYPPSMSDDRFTTHR